MARSQKTIVVAVPGVFEDASGELETLRDELQEWYDNLPENFQNGDKGAELEEAISALDEAIDRLADAENQLAPYNLELNEERKVIARGKSEYMSRAKRCEDAITPVRFAVEMLQVHHEVLVAQAKTEDDNNCADAVEEAINFSTEAIDAAESVEFPRMM